MQETWVWSLGREDPLEKEMATHSSILAWRIPWTQEPCKPQSMGLQRVRPDWAPNTFTFINHNMIKFGVYICWVHPTGFVGPSIKTSIKTDERVWIHQWFNEYGTLHVWSRVLEQHSTVCSRWRAGYGVSLCFRWVKITHYRGIDVKWVHHWVSQVALVVKNLPANAGDAGDTRDAGSISGLGRSPEDGMATCSSILAWGIPWREAWLATIHKVTKSQMWLKGLSTQALTQGHARPLSPLDKNNHQLRPGQLRRTVSPCSGFKWSRYSSARGCTEDRRTVILSSLTIQYYFLLILFRIFQVIL